MAEGPEYSGARRRRRHCPTIETLGPGVSRRWLEEKEKDPWSLFSLSSISIVVMSALPCSTWSASCRLIGDAFANSFKKNLDSGESGTDCPLLSPASTWSCAFATRRDQSSMDSISSRHNCRESSNVLRTPKNPRKFSSVCKWSAFQPRVFNDRTMSFQIVGYHSLAFLASRE